MSEWADGGREYESSLLEWQVNRTGYGELQLFRRLRPKRRSDVKLIITPLLTLFGEDHETQGPGDS